MEGNVKTGDKNNDKRNYRTMTMVAFILVMIAVCVGIFSYCVSASYKSDVKQQRNLVNLTNQQMEKTVDNYLQMLESTTKMLFTNTEYVEYDATNTKNDEYQALQKENEISDYLISLSALENYSDFGIVYSNNHHIGRINDGTTELYGKNLYSALGEALDGKKNCWTTGFEDDYKRLFYLCRVNDNALLVMSVYTDEISRAFTDNQQTDNVTIVLTDSQKGIIYSSDSEMTGVLDEEYTKDWVDDKQFSVVDLSYIESVNSCGSDWHIVSIYDLSQRNMLFKKIAMFCLAILCAGILLLLIIEFLFIPQQKNVNSILANSRSKMATVDGLTGLCNAETAENLIAEKIDTCITGSTIMLALVSIRNYDLIEKNYGVAGVNEALLTVSSLLQEIYGEKNIVGKTGENEFEIFADFTEYDLFKAHDRLKESLKTLEERLSECKLISDRGYINCCIGAAVYPDSSSDYDDLYEYAKLSLNKSAADKNRKYVLHKPQKQDKKGV